MTTSTLAERFRAARRDPALAVLEDFHPLKHALRFGATVLEVVATEPARIESLARLLAPDLVPRLPHATRVPADVLAQLTPDPPRSGILAIARRPPVAVDALLADARPAPVVLLEDPSRLGNIGAAVRVTAAAGAAGLLSLGEHDPWHPAALRGAAGLQFAVPVARIDALPECNRPLVVVDAEGEPLAPGRLPERALLAFGNERAGVSHALQEAAALRVGIPMRAGVSSLNLATAVAVVLYAWRFGAPDG
ncbi:MAG TPA: TrmH family RNA methyltransferase [Longimicrobiales bacterium]|nr:TrmH family RNA methyltransferase [Longimicrobiales bacterium]